MNPIPTPETKERILAAAETLFAEHGFDGTSLRQVTQKAEVNLAAVNYHFGGKEALICEVLTSRLDELNRLRLAALERYLQQPEPQISGVLTAFIEPALESGGDANPIFFRVLARAYVYDDQRLHDLISKRYGHVIKRFAGELQTLLPWLPPQELHWRLDFVIGALTYAMAGFGRNRGYHDAGQNSSRLVSAKLIEFAATALSADFSEHKQER